MGNMPTFADYDRSVALRSHLHPLQPYLDDPGITEICVNRPGEIWCERGNKWETHDVEKLTYSKCESIAIATAHYATNKDITDLRPILSADLPNGERIQVMRPPCTVPGVIAMTIRKPSRDIYTMEQYQSTGFFNHVGSKRSATNIADELLMKLYNEGSWLQFLRCAVQFGKCIVICGETGSGKTSFMKTLVQEIPHYKRVLTAEDVLELSLPRHPNHVRFLYPGEGMDLGVGGVTPGILLRAAMRMKPSVFLYAEVRGPETFEFINSVQTGHGTSITSMHANNCDMAFELLRTYYAMNPNCKITREESQDRQIRMTVDIIVHVYNDFEGDLGRHISDVYFDPTAKSDAMLRRP